MWFVISAFAAEVIAVLPFAANAVGDELAPLGAAAADMLVTDLARAEGLVVVERSRLNALLAELALQQSDYVDPASAARLGQGLGAGRVVVGSVNVAAAGLRLDARVVDVATGAVVGAASATGAQQDFFALEADVAAQLYRHFGVELTVADAGKPRTLDEAIAGGSRLIASDEAVVRELRGVTVYRRERLVRRDGAHPNGVPWTSVRNGSGVLLSSNALAALPGVDPTPVQQVQRRARRNFTRIAAVCTALTAGSVAAIVASDREAVDVTAGVVGGLAVWGNVAWIPAAQSPDKILVTSQVYSAEQIDALIESHNGRLAAEHGVSERRRREIDAEPVRFD